MEHRKGEQAQVQIWHTEKVNKHIETSVRSYMSLHSHMQEEQIQRHARVKCNTPRMHVHSTAQHTTNRPHHYVPTAIETTGVTALMSFRHSSH